MRSPILDYANSQTLPPYTAPTGGWFSSIEDSSVDGELVLFSGTSGRVGRKPVSGDYAVIRTALDAQQHFDNLDQWAGIEPTVIGANLAILATPSPSSYLFATNLGTVGYKTPAQVLSNIGAQAALGFTPENAANKIAAFSSPTDVQYPTAKLVSDQLDLKVSSTESSTVDGQVSLFNGTGGKIIRKATATGIAKLSSGVLSTVTAPTGNLVGHDDTQTLYNKTLALTTVADVGLNFVRPNGAGIIQLLAQDGVSSIFSYLPSVSGILITAAEVSGAYVPTSRTVNGHVLSGNVTVTPTDLGLVIGTNVQAWDADLDTWATKTPYAGALTITTAKTFNITSSLTLASSSGSPVTLNVGLGGTLGSAAFVDSVTFEPALGSPVTSGSVLASTNVGVRSWLVLGTAAIKDTGTTSGTIPLLGTGGRLSNSRIPLGLVLSDASLDLAADFENRILYDNNGNQVVDWGTGTLIVSGPTRLASLTTNGFVKTSGGTGALSIDTASYQPASAGLASLAAASTTDVFYYLSAANVWSPVTIGGDLVFDAGGLEVHSIPSTYLDTNGGLTANSDTKVASQKAVKTYVDAHAITNSAGATIVPVSNGTNLIASSIVDDGSAVSGGYGSFRFLLNGDHIMFGDILASGNNTLLTISDVDDFISLNAGVIAVNGSTVNFGSGGTVLYAGGIGSSRAGSFSGVGTATTSFVVTIGVTMANNTYKVNVTPTAELSAAIFYISAKTTTTFTVTYLAGLTGTVLFDWAVFP